jgi:hypothetical protein
MISLFSGGGNVRSFIKRSQEKKSSSMDPCSFCVLAPPEVADGVRDLPLADG